MITGNLEYDRIELDGANPPEYFEFRVLLSFNAIMIHVPKYPQPLQGL